MIFVGNKFWFVYRRLCHFLLFCSKNAPTIGGLKGTSESFLHGSVWHVRLRQHQPAIKPVWGDAHAGCALTNRCELIHLNRYSLQCKRVWFVYANSSRNPLVLAKLTLQHIAFSVTCCMVRITHLQILSCDSKPAGRIVMF